MKIRTFSICLLMIVTSVALLSFPGCKKSNEDYSIYIKRSNLKFDYDENRLQLTFSNISDNTINWTVNANDEFISFNKDLGSLNPNEKESFDVIVNREFLSGDSVKSELFINSSAGDNVTVSITVSNFPEKKIRLGYRVLDAVYSKNTDKLYILPDYPNNFIEVFDAVEKTFERIVLPGSTRYRGISISYDEKLIGVYRDKYLLIFDLSTNQVTGEHYFGKGITSVVFAPGQKVYAFPGNSYYIDLYCLDLSNNEIQEFDFDNYSSGRFVGKLHPTKKYIYAIDDYYYNDKLLKLSIIDSIPGVEYKESIDDFNNNLWFSHDGTKVFSRTNSYLNIDPTMSGNDIISTANFTFNYHYVHDMNYSFTKQEYYIIPEYDNHDFTDKVLIYDESLNYKEMIQSEDFMYRQNGNKGYGYIKALTNRVFSTKTGDQLILIIKPENGNYHIKKDAIQIIER